MATGDRHGDRMTGLTEFQTTVAQLFFGLPASNGFLLAGGSALLASGLTTRPTHDLDFFGGLHDVDLPAARDQFEAAVARRGWTSSRLHDTATFVRLHVVGEDELIVEFAIDAPAGQPPVMTMVGPTLAAEELAGRKLLALFGRAEARDFTDVHVLALRFGRETLLERAVAVDSGLDRDVLAEMMRSLARFTDDELPIGADDVDELRAYFAEWADELSESG